MAKGERTLVVVLGAQLLLAASWCEGLPLLKRAVTCIGVLAGVGFIRELIGWVYHYKFPTMEYPPEWLPEFPTVEAALFWAMLMGLLDVSMELTTSKCTRWIVVGGFCVVFLVAFFGFCLYRVHTCSKGGSLTWQNSNAKSAEQFREDMKKFKSRTERMTARFSWFCARRIRGQWTPLTPHSKPWTFLLNDTSKVFGIYVMTKISGRVVSAISMNNIPGVTGTFLLMTFSFWEAILNFATQPFKDNWRNYVDAICGIINAIVLFFAGCRLCCRSMLTSMLSTNGNDSAETDEVHGELVMYMQVVSTGLQLILTLFDPIMDMIDGLGQLVVLFFQTMFGAKMEDTLASFFLFIYGFEDMLYFLRVGHDAYYAAILYHERQLRRRAFYGAGKLDLAAFLRWKLSLLGRTFNTWVGERFGSVVALEHSREQKYTKARKQILQTAISLFRGHSTEILQEHYSPWDLSHIEIPDKECLELVVELDMCLSNFTIGRQRAKLCSQILKDISKAIKGDNKKILITNMKPGSINGGTQLLPPPTDQQADKEEKGSVHCCSLLSFRREPDAQLNMESIIVSVQLLPGVCGEKRLKEVFDELQAQVGVVDSKLMRGQHTRKTKDIRRLIDEDEEMGEKMLVKIVQFEIMSDRHRPLWYSMDLFVKLTLGKQTRTAFKTRTTSIAGGTWMFGEILELQQSRSDKRLHVQIHGRNDFSVELLGELDIDLTIQTYLETLAGPHLKKADSFNCMKDGEIQGVVKLAFAKDPFSNEEEDRVNKTESLAYLVEEFFDPSTPEFQGSKVKVMEIQRKWVRIKIIESGKLLNVSSCHLTLPSGARWDGLGYPNIVRLIRNYHLSLAESDISSREQVEWGTSAAASHAEASAKVDASESAASEHAREAQKMTSGMQNSSASKYAAEIASEYARRVKKVTSGMQNSNASKVSKCADISSEYARRVKKMQKYNFFDTTTNVSNETPRLDISADVVTVDSNERNPPTFPDTSTGNKAKICADISSEYARRVQKMTHPNSTYALNVVARSPANSAQSHDRFMPSLSEEVIDDDVVPLGIPLPSQHPMDIASFTDAMNRLSQIEAQQRHQEDRILEQQHVLNTLQQIQQEQNQATQVTRIASELHRMNRAQVQVTPAGAPAASSAPSVLARERAPDNMWAGTELEKHVGDEDRSMTARRLEQRSMPEAKRRSDVDPWREFMLRGTGSIL